MLVRIMGCKEREENINKLIPQLGDNVEVIWDEKHNSIDTLCRALDTEEGIIILEDDIELCNNFLERALLEIENHSDCFIMFYSSNFDEMHNYEDEGFNGPRVRTQSFYVPKGSKKNMIKYIKDDKTFAPKGRYSNPMCQFLKKEGIKMHLVKPSLVQHLWFGSLIPGHENCCHTSKTYKK